ncbi:hypothetical protein lerEdw1_015812 [Lerista edwardsae]|nr:hypothetical protein lerEdw1_015812 [Lerista edwardsae]
MPPPPPARGLSRLPVPGLRAKRPASGENEPPSQEQAQGPSVHARRACDPARGPICGPCVPQPAPICPDTEPGAARPGQARPEPQTSQGKISQPMEKEKQLEETVDWEAQAIGRVEEANAALRGRIRDLTAQLEAAEKCFVTHGILFQRVGFSESLDGHEKGKLTPVCM